MKYIVLGAGGCFGTNLADLLLKEGHEVVGVGRSPKKPPYFSLNVNYPYYAYHLTYEHEYVMKLLDKEKPDYVVCFAAQGEGAASFGDDNWRFYETNCVGLVRLVGQLKMRLPYYLKKFINIGTSELYGSVTKPSFEDDKLVPTSPYSVSKASFDLHLQAMFKTNGFPMNIIRPCNCYCPGQQLHRIIPKTMLFSLTGRKLPLHGGGTAKKSFLHATDLSRAILMVSEKGDMGEVYNVGSDQPTSIKEVVERCVKITGRQFKDVVELSSERKGQDSCYWLNSDKIKSLGWKPEIGWDEGLETMYQWVSSYLDDLSKQPTDFRMRA